MGIWTFLNPLNWFGRKRNGLRLRVRAELYEGDIHPVVDVEGIGPVFEKQLAEVGIVNTDQLLAHPAAAVAAAINTPEKRVRSWQSMAELAVVNGIGPQYAEALTRGGVDGIRDLVSRDAKVVSREVNAHLDSLGTTVTGGRVSETRIQTWQGAARAMKRRRVTVRLFGEPLPPQSKQARKDRAANGHTNQGRTNSVRTTTTSVPPATKATGSKSGGTTKAATPNPTKAATCAALTAAGSPCKRAPRDGSKYCASHKGRRAPAKPAAAKTPKAKTQTQKVAVTRKAPATKTAPKAKAAGTGRSTATTTTKSAGKPTGRVHVTHNGYRLYQKGNRFYFSKKSQAEVRPDGAEPVYEVPKNREIKVTQNGLPVLKGKS